MGHLDLKTNFRRARRGSSRPDTSECLASQAFLLLRRQTKTSSWRTQLSENSILYERTTSSFSFAMRQANFLWCQPGEHPPRGIVIFRSSNKLPYCDHLQWQRYLGVARPTETKSVRQTGLKLSKYLHILIHLNLQSLIVTIFL